jgi:hypothetical protein
LHSVFGGIVRIWAQDTHQALPQFCFAPARKKSVPSSYFGLLVGTELACYRWLVPSCLKSVHSIEVPCTTIMVDSVLDTPVTSTATTALPSFCEPIHTWLAFERISASAARPCTGWLSNTHT